MWVRRHMAPMQSIMVDDHLRHLCAQSPSAHPLRFKRDRQHPLSNAKARVLP